MKIDKRKLELQLSKKQWHQKDLADNAGIAYKTITEIMKRESARPCTVSLIAKALEVDIEDLLGSK